MSAWIDSPGVPNRWVLITNCARGLGRALIQPCRDAGWGVIATSEQLSDLDGLPSGSDLYRKALDANRPATINDTLLGCSDLRLIALINISEHGLVSPLETFLPVTLRTTFETQVVAPQALTQAFLPLLKQNAKGGEARIIQVLSILGRVTLPNHGPYSAAEHALLALTETLKLEVGPTIQVLVVEHGSLLAPRPGMLNAPSTDHPVQSLRQGTEHIDDKPCPGGPEIDLSRDLEATCAMIVSALSAKHIPTHISIGPDAQWVARYQGLLPSWLWKWLWRRRCRRAPR